MTSRAEPRRAAPRLLDHASFGALRLASFLPGVRVVPPSPKDPGSGRRLSGTVIVEVEGWEYDDKVWVGEVIGFTEVLRLARSPETTRSVAIELAVDGKRAAGARALLEAIGLPLRQGMRRAAVEKLLGRPIAVRSFGPDRETLEHRVGGRGRSYRVRSTIEKARGLTYVVVQRR